MIPEGAIHFIMKEPWKYVGAGLGIGKLAASALDGIARQPEAQPKIQTAMIIAAALIEGVALFCAVICLIGLK